MMKITNVSHCQLHEIYLIYTTVSCARHVARIRHVRKNLSIETGRKEAGHSGNMGIILDVQKFALMWTGLK